MDYEREVLAKRASHHQLAYGELWWIRGMHLMMLVSVLINPMWGPLLVSLAVLLHRGEEYPLTEREAFEAVNFGLVVAIAQLPAYALWYLSPVLGVDGIWLAIPHVMLAIATLRYCWRAFRSASDLPGARYPERFQLIVYNRRYFPPVNNRRRQSFRERYRLSKPTLPATRWSGPRT